MKADEIRKLTEHGLSATGTVWVEKALWEIAAQLAELNENLNRMVNDQGALDVVVLK